MVQSITGLDKIYPKSSHTGRLDKGRGLNPEATPPTSQADSVQIQPDSLRGSLQTQIDKLKTELPGIIADAILDPVEDQATRNAPMNALIFRLENPLQSILAQTENLPSGLVIGLREEVERFKEALPGLSEDALLAPFQEDKDQQAFLNRILGGLSKRLDGLTEHLNQALPV